MTGKVHLQKNVRWHPAVWRARMRARWPFVVWLLAIVAAIYLYGHGGKFGGMAGVVDATRELVAPLETARIRSIHVIVGQHVRAGDVLARMDTTILDSEMALEKLQTERRFAEAVSEARSDLRDASIQQAKYEGELAVLEAELQRLDGLLQKRLIDAQDVTRLRARYEALSKATELYPELLEELGDDLASAEERQEATAVWMSSSEASGNEASPELLGWDIETGRSRLGLLHLRRESYVLRARADGMVSAIFREAGEVVPAGDTIISLITEGTVQVVGYLPETSVHEVSRDMHVYVELARGGGEPINGKVISMVPEIMGLPNRLNPFPGRTFRGRHVMIALEEGHDLLPGEAVSVRLHEPLVRQMSKLLASLRSRVKSKED